jgi:hypothetical protein
MATKKYFSLYGSSSIRDGSKIRFSEDKWLGEPPFENNIQLCIILYGIK